MKLTSWLLPAIYIANITCEIICTVRVCVRVLAVAAHVLYATCYQEMRIISSFLLHVNLMFLLNFD